jgi:hypothetical protein
MNSCMFTCLISHLVGLQVGCGGTVETMLSCGVWRIPVLSCRRSFGLSPRLLWIIMLQMLKEYRGKEGLPFCLSRHCMEHCLYREPNSPSVDVEISDSHKIRTFITFFTKSSHLTISSARYVHYISLHSNWFTRRSTSVKKFSFCFTENTPCLYYKDQRVNNV